MTTHRDTLSRLSADFSVETLQARREWQDMFKVMKGKKLQPVLLYPTRLSFRFDGGNQKLSIQAKFKKIQHCQTSFTTNAKETSLGRKHQRRKRPAENKPRRIKKMIVRSNAPPKRHRLAQFSHSVMSNSLGPHGLQHASLPCPSPMPRACSNSCPLSQWCHPTISSSVVLFSTSLQSFQASGSFPISQFFTSGGQILEFQLQQQSFHWIFRTVFLWDWLVWSPGSPRDSQESFPTPQFESICSLVLSFLYGPTLTSIHDY